jgi:hypothetical protein
MTQYYIQTHAGFIHANPDPVKFTVSTMMQMLNGYLVDNEYFKVTEVIPKGRSGTTTCTTDRQHVWVRQSVRKTRHSDAGEKG